MKLFSRQKSRPEVKDLRFPETKSGDKDKKEDSGTLVRPILSEKASDLENANRAYVFEVASRATKPAIKKAVEQTFGVKVESINIINKKPKRRLWRGKVGRVTGLKKAIVKVAAGQKIEVLPK